MRFPEAREEGKKCLDECEEEEEWSRSSSSDSDAPDGGWGWLVLLASFLNIVVVDGVCFSFGIIMPEFIRVFGMSNTEAGWLGSTLAGSYLLVGPFVSAMCAKYGCRTITTVGAVVACIGFAASAWCTSMASLLFFYGVVAGVGFGMIYLPSIVVVGYWFEKKRALATGIALCGSGVGQFLFAPLSGYLMAEYGWEGKMNLIIAGIVLNCAVCGRLFFPLENYVTAHRGETTAMVEIDHGTILKAQIIAKNRERDNSNGSLDNCVILQDNRLIRLDPKMFELRRNDSFIAQLKKRLGFSSESLINSKSSIHSEIPSIVIDAVQKEHNSQKNSPILRPSDRRVQQLSQTSLQKRGSLPEGTNLPDVTSSTSGGLSKSQIQNGGISNGSAVKGMPKTQSFNTLPLQSSHASSSLQNFKAVPVEGNWLVGSMEGDSSIDGVIGGPPDITRSAMDLQTLDRSVISIQVIPNGACHHGNSTMNFRQRSSKSEGDNASHVSCSQTTYLTGSMMSQPDVQSNLDLYEQQHVDQSFFMRCWEVLCDMIDLKLLKNPVFAILVVSSFITLLAFFVPYFYLPKKGIDIGLPPEHASFLLSIVGVTNTVGRIIAGWLADRPWCNTLYMNNAALIIAGVALLLCYECTNAEMLAVVAALFGLCLAVFNSLRSIMLVDLLGLETLTKSFGLLILFQGIAAVIGAPLAGYIEDCTGSVDKSFLVAGVLIVVSGLIMFPIKCLQINQDGERPNIMPYAATPLPIQKTLKLPQSNV